MRTAIGVRPTLYWVRTKPTHALPMPWEVLVRAYNPNDAARVFRDIQQERGITDHPTFCFVSLLHEPDEWEAGLVYESHGEPIRIELDWTD